MPGMATVAPQGAVFALGGHRSIGVPSLDISGNFGNSSNQIYSGMKRFVDTDEWEQDEFFLLLPTAYKLFWRYIREKCDNGGVWTVNRGIVKMYFCGDVDFKTAEKLFIEEGHRVFPINGGERWWIPGFIVFQFGRILSDKSPIHKSVLKSLEENGLTELYKKYLDILPQGQFFLKNQTLAKGIATHALEIGKGSVNVNVYVNDYTESKSEECTGGGNNMTVPEHGPKKTGGQNGDDILKRNPVVWSNGKIEFSLEEYILLMSFNYLEPMQLSRAIYGVLKILKRKNWRDKEGAVVRNIKAFVKATIEGMYKSGGLKVFVMRIHTDTHRKYFVDPEAVNVAVDIFDWTGK